MAKTLPATLPERLDADIKSRGLSQSGGKREIWENKQYGIQLTVTWAPPYPEIGIQQFSCKHMPGYQFTNYNALRAKWAELHEQGKIK